MTGWWLGDHEVDGYRLPTDAEWQPACRAGKTGARYGELDDIAGMRRPGGRVHVVGLKQPNAWGLFDMLGGCEWCWTSTIPRSMVPTASSAVVDGAIRSGVAGQGFVARRTPCLLVR